MTTRQPNQNLLRQIQESATGVDAPLAVVLRQCKVLAKRLGNDRLDQWVDRELDGYPDIATLPNYRVMQAEVRGDFSGWGGSGLQNVPVPQMCVDAEHRDFLFTVRFADGVAEYERLLSDHQGLLQNAWPADYVVLYSRRVYKNMNCLAAWRVVSSATISGVLDTVRSRVLSFALELEAAAPDAGEAQIGSEPIPQERVNQYFNTYIMGGQNVWAAGGRDVMQEVCQVGQGDWEGLRKALGDLRIPDVEVEALERAVHEDRAAGDGGNEPGPAVRGWLGSVSTKIASGTLAVSNNETTGGIVAGLVLVFLGHLP